MSSSQQESDKVVVVKPWHVVAGGSAVMAAGALASTLVTYRRGTKTLVEEGVQPSARMQAVPMALKALALSTLMTCCFGAAGFWALKEYGFFKTDRAELPSAKEAARLMKNPRAFFSELFQGAEQELKGRRTNDESSSAS